MLIVVHRALSMSDSGNGPERRYLPPILLRVEYNNVFCVDDAGYDYHLATCVMGGFKTTLFCKEVASCSL